MGRLKKQTLGKISGKVGNIVLRDFGYDQFISFRPDRYNIKKDIKAASHKLRFYYSIKLAKLVFNFPVMKNVWNNCNMPGKRGYTRMISANIELLKDNLPSVENIITPKGRALLFDIVELNNKEIKFSFEMAGLIKPPFVMTLLFQFFNPHESVKNLSEILECRFNFKPDLEEKINNINEKGKYGHNYVFSSEMKSQLESYKNVILYAAVVGTPTIEGKAWWTSTVAVDISGVGSRE